MSEPYRAPRKPLPTKAEIWTLTGADAVIDLKDDIERTILHIEAQLEFSDGDDGWAPAAQRALALHRFTFRLLKDRLDELVGSRPRKSRTRPADANHGLTNEALARRWSIDLSALTDVQAVDAEAAIVGETAEALSLDRSDEIARPSAARDEAFLSVTGTLLRHLRSLRQQLQTRRGQLSRAARAPEIEAADRRRERAFVEASRTMLDRETFIRIWAAVDQLEPRISA